MQGADEQQMRLDGVDQVGGRVGIFTPEIGTAAAQNCVEAVRDPGFGEPQKLLLRFHDNDRKTGSWKRNSIKGPDVINVTMYPDIQELLAFCDAAITDYSSWIYDFMLTKKPGFLFAMDKKKYNDERGFYFRLEDTPFPVSTNTEELAASILSFDADGTYKDKVESFLEGKGCMDDGHASERIAAQCLDWMGITH